MKVFASPYELLSAQGEVLGVSPWLRIDQSRIQQFAEATDDLQWIHVDEERAKNGPFGACIAHGYLTLSLVSRFMPEIFSVSGVAMGINYGLNKVRFPAPVRVGSQVRAQATLLSAQDKGDCIESIVKLNIEIEHQDKPACVVETVSRYYPLELEE